jgi:two-component system phosphate regulon sensor histidine kinase PhoR
MGNNSNLSPKKGDRPLVRVLTSSLRTRILAAILATVIITDLLAVWAVNDRMLAGVRREADTQARAQAAQARALYTERSATLAAEGETVSFYPAVISALGDGNAAPLLQWSRQVAELQHTSVSVVDGAGRVIARGHAPEQSGDDLTSRLAGLRLALAGQKASGTEDGDELGLALRGYAPVWRGNSVVGAIMIAEPFDDRLLRRLGAGVDGSATALRIEPAGASPSEPCLASGAAATCRFALLSPAGQAAASLVLTVSLADVEGSHSDAQRALWLTGLLVLVGGGIVAWLLSRSLTAPLERLTSAAYRIASGTYDGEPLQVSRVDEISVLGLAFETMRERVGATTGELRDERDVVDAVLQSAGDGILMVDPSGNRVLANARWSELLGAGDGLAAANDLTRVGRSGQDAAFSQAFQGWLADPGRIVVEDFERVGTSPAAYHRFRCYTAPVRRRDGATIGRILVLRDITREGEAERMRSALISNVSHELRSPLTSIKGYVETLIQGGPWDPDEEREFLGIISTAADKLASLVDNLLDAAKMEAGVLTLEREPVRVERIAQQMLAHKQPLTPTHELRLDAEPGLPIVHADPMRVEQVITNLVENAIKYSPNGGPITVRLESSAGTIGVSVTDQGIGVPPGLADRLFERFYRADGEAMRTIKGLGLGLFISKSLVEAHGGQIGVVSGGTNKGSTFWFTLPSSVEPIPADEATLVIPGHRLWEAAR